MRIRHKIFAGYLALIAVSVALVIFFLFTLSNINRSYGHLIISDQRVLLLANNLRSAVQRQVVAAHTYEQLSGTGLIEEFEEAIQAQGQAIEEIGPLLSQSEDLQALEVIKDARSQYTGISRQIIDLARAGMQDEAIEMSRTDAEPVRIRLVSECDSFIEKKSKEVAVEEARLGEQVNEASTRLLMGAIIGILAALLVATLITEGLTAPVRRLMSNIRGITSGDLDTPVVASSKDEIGELASVLETMRRRLAAAAVQNEDLLNSAREEAEKLANVQHDLETANAELEEALATESDARRRIEEINRLKAEFAGMVSHELKTPVSYVYNYAVALKDHNTSLNDGQRHEFLASIQSEALHLLTLIDDILAISLLESGGLNHRFVETDLRKLTDSVVKDQQITTRRHTFTVKGPRTLPVRADPTRLKQVLNNLLSNAIKYSPQGGSVEVRLKANPGGKKALIYVRDHGIGIRAGDVPRLFDRFSRIQSQETMAIPGSGLGLYIAHHIVEAHGGTLSLEPAPAPGKGTIAQVTVPLMPGVKAGEDDGEDDQVDNGHSEMEGIRL